MPRPKKYDVEEVLDVAMALFWNDGYAATPISALTKAMGINKFTFYKNFGSKEELLLHTMQYFKRSYSDHIVSKLKESSASIDALIQFFQDYLEHTNLFRNGCYILSITTETGTSIEPARLMLKEYIGEIESVLIGANSRIAETSNGASMDIKGSQLYNLFLSLMLVSSVHSYESCIEFMEKTITLIYSR